MAWWQRLARRVNVAPQGERRPVAELGEKTSDTSGFENEMSVLFSAGIETVALSVSVFNLTEGSERARGSA